MRKNAYIFKDILMRWQRIIKTHKQSTKIGRRTQTQTHTHISTLPTFNEDEEKPNTAEEVLKAITIKTNTNDVWNW